MKTSLLFAGALSLGLTTFYSDVASSQDFPAKPIRVVTQTIDAVSRLLADELSNGLGQQVVLDSRPSGSTIAEVAVLKAPADGYTLFLGGSSFWIGPLLKEMPYGQASDFAPVTLIYRSPNILVVHPSLPVKNVKELIALAKSRPGELNYSAGGVGASPHMAAELFNSMAGVKITRIPFTNSDMRIASVVRGDVQMEFSPAPVAKLHMGTGKLKGIAVTTLQRSALAPALPTIAESGLPGYQYDTLGGLFAPPKTPAAIVTRINHEAVRSLTKPDVKEKFLSAGTEAAGSSPEEFAATIKTQTATAAKVIKEANIRLE